MSTTITDYAGLVAVADDLTADYILGNDINASGNIFTPLGTFTGTLDAKGYKVKDLTITVSASGTQSGALFLNNSAGTISNLGLEDCVISVTSTDGHAGAGGLAVTNSPNGTITNCYVTGTITAVSGSGGTAGAGGMCYSNSGTISKSYSTATVTASGDDAWVGGFTVANYGPISESYSTGNATASGSGDNKAGGFTAYNYISESTVGLIDDCYAKGNATASGGSTNYAGGFVELNHTTAVITNCYSIGVPTGADGVGGFCRSNNQTITACFWDTTTSGEASSDGGTGKTTAQMQTEATYAAWNFVDTWAIVSTHNDGYPYLGTIVRRPHTTPIIYDEKGRIPKGARVEARRNDTGTVVETQTLDSNGQATFTNLPNNVGVTFYASWGGIAEKRDMELLYSTIIGVAEGGTGSSTPSTARTNLGLGVNSTPQFLRINLGHASDTPLSRTAQGRVNIANVNIVRGPSSATDNAIARFNNTTGDLIQEYTSNPPTISDSGDVNIDGDLDVENIVVSGNVDGVDVSVHDPATTGVHGISGTIVGTSESQTLTNKTLIATTNTIEEISTVASSATPAPTGGSLRNFFTVTALAAGATFAAPSGTPANANKLVIRIKDDGTARALAWNAIYRDLEFDLPTTTVISKTVYLGFIYNSTDSRWDTLAINQEP